MEKKLEMEEVLEVIEVSKVETFEHISQCNKAEM